MKGGFKMKKIFLGFLILSVLLLVSNFVSAQVKGKNYVQGVTKDEILIASPWAMTGSAAYFGAALLETEQLCFNEVNAKGGIYGRKLRIISEDDACTPVKGVAAIQKLLADKPFMIYGCACSGVALAGLETITKEGIPFFTVVSTAKLLIPHRRNVFRTSVLPDDGQGKVMTDYAIENLHLRKVAIIHDATEYGKGGADVIVARLAEYGLKPVAIEAYNAGDVDFTTQILRVKDTKPEAVMLYAYAKEGTIVVRQAKELGLNAQIITSASVTVPSFLEGAGDGAIGVLQTYPASYLIDAPEPLIVDFVNKMKTSFRLMPGRPSLIDLQGIGAVMVAVEGLRRAGKDLTWEKYITALEGMKDFKTGFMPPTTFSPTDHNGQKSTRFLVVLPGKKWSMVAEEVVAKEKVEKVQ
jgi:branched-chain amino acid transport system substrate-binding protein